MKPEKKYEVYEVQERSPALIGALVNVWEASVRVTHLFLSEPGIEKIKAYVPQALRGVAHLIVVERQSGDPAGFMGTENGRLEMLFLAPEEREQGLGKQLLQYGIAHYGIRELTVNEQNPQAVGFYKHVGFDTYKRTEYDEEGNPYPLLYMKLVKAI